LDNYQIAFFLPPIDVTFYCDSEYAIRFAVAQFHDNGMAKKCLESSERWKFYLPNKELFNYKTIHTIR